MGDTLKELEDKNKSLEKQIEELRRIVCSLQESPKE
jgi:predicted RNase H-like nuclease (RuvC/YqgF family)